MPTSTIGNTTCRAGLSCLAYGCVSIAMTLANKGVAVIFHSPWSMIFFLLLLSAPCTLAEQPLSPSLTARPCLFTLPDTAWTSSSLSSWLKSKELRLLARNIQRYKHTNRKLFADTCKKMDVPPDWNKCSHGIKAARNTMLACSRSILIASLLSDWKATKTLVSRAVLVMPPERWARLGVAQTAIALLLGLQQEGRPINIQFLKVGRSLRNHR